MIFGLRLFDYCFCFRLGRTWGDKVVVREF